MNSPRVGESMKAAFRKKIEIEAAKMEQAINADDLPLDSIRLPDQSLRMK
jgi:hypothetical protein